MMEKEAFPPMSVLYFIKRKTLLDNRLFFKEGIVHEDELWAVKTILRAHSVLLTDFNFYFYRQRAGSIMQSGNKTVRAKSLFEVAKELNSFVDELKKKKVSGDVVAFVYARIFWIYHYISSVLYQDKPLDYPESGYFSKLLTVIYASLPHSLQRYCLNKYCLAQVIFNNESDSVHFF
jgi:hypothetical protein